MPSFDVLTLGSVTIDIILPLGCDDVILDVNTHEGTAMKIPLGDKLQVDDALITCGGGSGNTATGFSKLGLKTAALGIMGDGSYRSFLEEEMKNAGVCTDYITTANGQMSSFSVILHPYCGERTVFNHRTQGTSFPNDLLIQAPKTKGLYIGHLANGAAQTLHTIPDYKTQNPNTIIGWNPGKTQFKKGFETFKELYPHIDILVINVEEAEMFTGLKSQEVAAKAPADIIGERINIGEEHQVENRSDVRALAQVFLEAGVKHVAITDGGRGAQCFDGQNHYLVAAQKTVILDTLGAGDAFSTGYMTAYLKDLPTKTCIRYACKASNGVIQAYGGQAGQLTEKEMKAVLTGQPLRTKTTQVLACAV